MYKDIVLLSTADWSNPFWTNKQHVAVALAGLGYRVFYVDSLGLRKPSASPQDLKRIFTRLKRAFKAPHQVQPNIWVWSPIILPFQNILLVRKFNRLVLSAWLSFYLKKLNFDTKILWTYNPLTTKLIDVKNYEKVVYHCVDNIKAQPGMPVQVLENSEIDLLKKASVVYVTAHELYESRKAYNSNIHYFSNVADFNHFYRAMDSDTVVPKDLANIPAPRVGFVGALSGYKVDFSLLKKAAEELPHVSFVLIGKVGEGDPWTNVSELEKIDNVHFLGPKSYDMLPGYLKGIDVSILPNLINEYTDSMFPMKFFEYLAAGKPVVSVNLKSLGDFSDTCFLSKDSREFIDNLEVALKDPNYNYADRISLAKSHTYDTRMKKMLAVL